METLVKVSIPTEVLQDLVGRVVNGSSLKPQLPLTCLLHLTLENKILTVTSTDDVNIMSSSAEIDTPDTLNIIVDAKQFSSLVSKITTNTIKLSVNGDVLTVEGNGKYDFNLTLEQDGTPISFPATYEYKEGTPNHITKENLKTILTMNKGCKSKQMDGSCLYDYYTDEERVLTTDTFKACNNKIKLFNSPVGVMSSTMDLVPYITDDTGVNIVKNGNDIIFYSTKGILIGKAITDEELNSFPTKELLESFNDNLPYVCIVNRTLFVNALDRLCLFTDPYDDNKITITFTNKNMIMKTTNNNETLMYLQDISSEPIEKVVDVDALLLKDSLSSCLIERLTFKFGSDNGVQIQCDSVDLLLGLLGEE